MSTLFKPVDTALRLRAMGYLAWESDIWKLQLNPKRVCELHEVALSRLLESDPPGRPITTQLEELYFEHKPAALMLCLYVVNQLNNNRLTGDMVSWWWRRFIKTVGWTKPTEATIVRMDAVAKLYGRLPCEV